MTIAQLCEYTRNTDLCTLKRQILWMWIMSQRNSVNSVLHMHTQNNTYKDIYMCVSMLGS